MGGGRPGRTPIRWPLFKKPSVMTDWKQQQYILILLIHM